MEKNETAAGCDRGLMEQEILIIAGNSTSRETMCAALATAGYAVREAADGTSGFAEMTNKLPDLVILDLWLPDIDGFDLVSQLRARAGSASIPMLAVTGFVAKADELRIVAAQFTDYLFKPVDVPLLLKTVRTHLGPALNFGRNHRGNRPILVIDDEPNQLKLLAMRLRHLGFVVETACNGIDGLALARQSQPAAIASDILMPGMDGFQLCMQVRSDPELAAIPIVLMSNNYAQEADKQLAHRVGANALVQTAPDFHEAVQAILASLETSTPLLVENTPSLQAAYHERQAQQLERQVQLNYELARRCAAQGAQISMLTQMGEKFLNGTVDRAALHTELVARYIDGAGFSCGAILLNEGGELVLSAQIGFPDEIAKSLPKLFADNALLRDAMLRGESLCLTTAPNTDDPSNRLLSSINAETVLVSSLRFGAEELGAIVLASQVQVLDFEWLSFSKAVTNQIAQVIALNQSITKLQYLASYDPLTRLPNRSNLHRQLQLAVDEGRCIALYLVNLDRFQEINNTLSYHNGDLLLQQVAERLSAGLPAGALAARLGADEFAILRHDIASVEDLHQSARQTLKSLDSTFQLAGLPVALRATMGIVLGFEPGDGADTLLSHADMARRAARETGHNYLVYPENVEPYDPDQLRLLGELRQAIESKELMLYYQPKISLESGVAVGVEALIRWHHPVRGWIAPDRFIPLAERAGLIHPLTLWVVEAALRQACEWRSQGIDLGIAVNISSQDLQDPAFADFAIRLCQSTGTAKGRLTFELTERSLMADPARAKGTLEEFSALGIRLSIDDFGTGYSALSYLQSLPVDEIKIDKSFISRFTADPRARQIVRSIIELGQGLAVGVVAEGIEAQETWDGLVELGCDLGQGYYIARPMPASDLADWLAQSRRCSRVPARRLEKGD
jgi:diguanylate cyclase (GGDEF)-like protein